MSTSKFAKTYNLVAFLKKPTKSEGFEQIVDFLNANPIKYALTGTTCLPNAAIFEELARMGYEKPSQKLTFYKAFFSHRWRFLIHTILQCLSAKTTVWNELNSTMAPAIICLANNYKFNFSKYILDNMVKNLEARVKFYMFPRFVQVFVNHQLGDMSHHNGIFVNPSLTKKVFANMKRLGTSFSGVITPLFKTMMVQVLKEVDEIPTDTQDTPILTQPSSSQPQRKHKPIKKQGKETEVPYTKPQTEEHIPTPSYDPLPSGKDRMQLSELMEICIKLSDRVLFLEQIKTNQAAKIKKLKKRVEKLEGKKKKRTHGLKRLYKVGLTTRIESFKEEEDQGRINDEDLFGVNDLDGDVVILDVTAAMDSEVMEGSKKTQAKVTEGSSKRVGDEIEQESAKRQRLEKEDDTAELKRCLEIVPEDDDDDVTIESTPLSSKSPTIVDYKIYKKGKKSYFRIIKADENSQNYLTFRTILRTSTEKT
uniref:Synaptobrevin, longin-like domain protein n=1 Tax=Tanacetum cinerariifolium TaxID=118510 RepID=A0A699IM92_TANCI|nr:hypothetical protein [Tanacetum cinerariifolium]